ncbi:MAG: OFA family MFS transporter [Planctomycetota bacterium]
MENKMPNRWLVILLAGFCVMLMLGIIYSWSVFKVPLQKADGLYKWTAQETTLPFSIFLLTFALMTIPAGRLQDKKGPRIGALLGGVLMGTGFMLASLVGVINKPIWLIAVYGIIAGAGCGLGYNAVIPCIRKWFPDKPGLSVGLVLGGFGLSAFVFSKIATSLIASQGLPTSFLICGIIVLVVIITAALFLKNPPEGYKPAGWTPPQAAANKPIVADYTFKEALSSWQFYALWIMFAFTAGAGLAVIGTIKPFATAMFKQGMTGTGTDVIDSLATWAVGLLSTANALGRPGGGFLMDKIGRKITMLIVFIIQAVFMSILVFCNTPATLFPVFIGIGLMFGSCLAIFPAATGSFFGTKNLGIIYGGVFTAYGAGGLIMPTVYNKISAGYGEYWGFQIMGILCVVAALVALMVKHPVKKTS